MSCVLVSAYCTETGSFFPKNMLNRLFLRSTDFVFSTGLGGIFFPGRDLAFGISGAGAASASSESRLGSTFAGTELEARWLTLREAMPFMSELPGGVASRVGVSFAVVFAGVGRISPKLLSGLRRIGW